MGVMMPEFCEVVATGPNNTIPFSRENVEELMYSNFDTAVVAGIMPTLLFTGLVTNLSFVFVVVRVPYMRTVTNYYLSQLAIADIALLVTAVGEKLWYYIASPIGMDESALGQAGCISTYVLKKAFYWASLFLVTLLNFERFFAVCWPLKHRHAQSKYRRQTLQRVLGVWITSVAVSLLGIPSNNRYVSLSISGPQFAEEDEPFEIGVCCPLTPTLDVVVLAAQGIMFIAFGLGNAVMSAATIRAINGRKVVAGAGLNCNLPARRLQNNVIARMLIVNGVIFFFFLIPRHCYDIAQVAHLEILHENQRNIVLNITRIILYLNSVINPVIYVVVNPRYRKAFRRAFLHRSRSIRMTAWT